MEMTITRALGELKLLSSKIEDKINGSTFVIANLKSSNKVGYADKKDVISNMLSDYQSVNDLIERRKRIKSAIVESNSKTQVVINGKPMTVAEAIERKTSIDFEKGLLNKISSQYNIAVSSANAQNEKVKNQIDVMLIQMLGSEGKQKAKEEDIDIIAKPYKEKYEYELVNPLNVEKLIEKLKSDINGFLTEVDYILSESNCITKITIQD